MAVPVYKIRVIRGKGEFSQNVHFHLPGDPAVSVPNCLNIYLDEIIDKTDFRHVVLGKFIDAWGRLEHTFGELFMKISGTNFEVSNSITSNISGRQISDIIKNISSARLGPLDFHNIELLLDRVGNFTTKRNIIIHGIWTFEVVTWAYGGDFKYQGQFVREQVPVDKRLSSKIANPKNQKDRLRHVFSLKRIEGVTREVLCLQSDIIDFIRNLKEATFGNDRIIISNKRSFSDK